MNQAYSVVGDPDKYGGRLLITCEHASNAVPAPLTKTPADQRWLDDHWGWDIGAADVVKELVRIKSCVGVLCGYSRLVIDANRELDHADLIRRQIYGEPLSFNRGLNDAEVDRRAAEFHAPYHEAVSQQLKKRLELDGDVLLLSVHSFTPELDGERRPMEIGVLFDNYEAVAERLGGLIEAQGFKTALNEPYSGMSGLIFSANLHGSNHGVIYIELEIRQDLIDTPEKAVEVARRLEPALTALQVRGTPRESR